MAGTSRDFNAADFREGIAFAMEMGAAPLEENRLTFHFSSTLVYTGPVDGENVPFDADADLASSETPDPVTVPCAVKYYDREGLLTNLGIVQPTRIEVTLLDDDYEQVKEASYVTAGGDRYDYRRTEPPSGLFDVGLFVMHFAARSET